MYICTISPDSGPHNRAGIVAHASWRRLGGGSVDSSPTTTWAIRLRFLRQRATCLAVTRSSGVVTLRQLGNELK